MAQCLCSADTPDKRVKDHREVKQGFNKTGQNVVIRHRAQPEICTDRPHFASDYLLLFPFLYVPALFLPYTSNPALVAIDSLIHIHHLPVFWTLRLAALSAAVLVCLKFLDSSPVTVTGQVCFLILCLYLSTWLVSLCILFMAFSFSPANHPIMFLIRNSNSLSE